MNTDLRRFFMNWKYLFLIFFFTSGIYAQESPLLESKRKYKAAIALASQGQYKQAKEYFLEVLEIEKRLYKNKPCPQIITTYKSIASVSQSLGQLEEAKFYMQQALKALLQYYQGKDHPRVALAYQDLAVLLRDTDKLEEASRLCQQALLMRKRLFREKDHEDIAVSLTIMGQILKRQQNFQESHSFFLQALEMGQRLHPGQSHPDIVTALNNMGAILASMGKYEESYCYYLQALDMQKRLSPKEGDKDIAIILSNLGSVLQDLGRLEESYKHYQEAFVVFQKIAPGKDSESLLIHLSNMALVLNMLGKLEESLEHLSQAIDMLQRLYPKQDSQKTIILLNNKGEALFHLGREEEAYTCFSKALAIHKKICPQELRHLATLLTNMGKVLHSQKKFEDAYGYFTKSLETKKKLLPSNHPSLATTLNSAGIACLSLGRFKEAEEYLTQAMEIKKQSHPSWKNITLDATLHNLACLNFLQANYSSSWQYNLSNWEILQDFYKQNLALWSTAQKVSNAYQSFFPTISLFLNLAAQDNQKYKEAYQYCLWYKGLVNRILSEEKKMVKQFQTEQSLQKVWQEYCAVKSQIAFCMNQPASSEKRLLELREKSKVLEMELSKQSKHFHKFIEMEKISIEQIQKELTEEKILLDFANYWDVKKQEACLGVFALTNSNISFHRLGSWKEFQEEIQNILAKIKHAGQNFMQEEVELKKYLQKFTQKILPSELQSLVCQKKTILVCPDDLLYPVPFEILMQEDKYFVEHYDIVYLSSGRDLLKQYNEYGEGFLGIGNPVFQENLELPALSSQELLTVKNYASSAQIYQGEEATESNFKKEIENKSWFWLHITTHGFYKSIQSKNKERQGQDAFQNALLFSMTKESRRKALDSNPLSLSGITFSEAGKSDMIEDGYATAEEIALLPLDKTYCAIFSCCETGLGTTQTGEGVLGFQWALGYAGVHHAILALWEIPDMQTHSLIEQFYEKSQKYPVWQALSHAKRILIQEFRQKFQHSHPSLWAGMICNGKPTSDLPRPLATLSIPEKIQKVPQLIIRQYNNFSQFCDIRIEDIARNKSLQLDHPMDVPSEITLSMTAKEPLYIYVGKREAAGNISWISSFTMVSGQNKNFSQKVHPDEIQSLFLIASFVEIDKSMFSQEILRLLNRGYYFSKRQNQYAVLVFIF